MWTIQLPVLRVNACLLNRPTKKKADKVSRFMFAVHLQAWEREAGKGEQCNLKLDIAVFFLKIYRYYSFHL